MKEHGAKTNGRKLAAAVAVAGAVVMVLSACNTVKGLGRDVESVGQAGEDAID